MFPICFRVRFQSRRLLQICFSGTRLKMVFVALVPGAQSEWISFRLMHRCEAQHLFVFIYPRRYLVAYSVVMKAVNLALARSNPSLVKILSDV